MVTHRIGKIGCKSCNWKGYTKHAFWNGEKEEFTVTVCSQCKDARGYHAYVKGKYGKADSLHLLPGQEPSADVIDFQKYKDSGEMKYYEKDETGKLAKEQFETYGEIPKRE